MNDQNKAPQANRNVPPPDQAPDAEESYLVERIMAQCEKRSAEEVRQQTMRNRISNLVIGFSDIEMSGLRPYIAAGDARQ